MTLLNVYIEGEFERIATYFSNTCVIRPDVLIDRVRRRVFAEFIILGALRILFGALPSLS